MCVPIYNALDPETHHPVAPDDRFTADLGLLANRLPDREARVEEFFIRAAEAAPNCRLDRKSTRLNSSHLVISNAVFCLKKKEDPITLDPELATSQPSHLQPLPSLPALNLNLLTPCSHAYPAPSVALAPRRADVTVPAPP